VDELKQQMHQQVNGGSGMNGNTVPILIRTRQLLGKSEDETGADHADIGFVLHTMARTFSNQPPGSYDKTYDAIWAVPGMADFLLNQSLVTPGMAKVRELYPNGWHHDDLTEAKKEEVLDLTNKSDLSCHNFAFWYYNILVRTVVVSRPTGSSIHDGRGWVRKVEREAPQCPVRAAAKRAMALWYDSDVRQCCGDALAPACSLCLTLLMRCRAFFRLGDGECEYDWHGTGEDDSKALEAYPSLRKALEADGRVKNYPFGWFTHLDEDQDSMVLNTWKSEHNTETNFTKQERVVISRNQNPHFCVLAPQGLEPVRIVCAALGEMKDSAASASYAQKLVGFDRTYRIAGSSIKSGKANKIRHIRFCSAQTRSVGTCVHSKDERQR
jgi:hypothetical protein